MVLIVVYFFLFFTMNFIYELYALETTVGNSSQGNDEVSFKTEITPFCNTSPGKLVITGDTVKFSEFLKWDGSFEEHCGNSTNVTMVYIFALRKIYIDRDMYAPGFDVFMLAPTWQVLTVSVIHLNGLDGEHMPTPQPARMGSDGESGRPGNPGKPGGNFYGVGETFIDGKYLTINVSGGDGGPGQDGGVGGIGQDGRHALKANLSLTCTHSACDGTGSMYITALDSEGEYSDFRCKEEYNYIIYDMFFLPPVSGNVRECSYYIYGAPGAMAGAGGDGGIGGIGGYPGHVYLSELFENSEVIKGNNSGKTGMEGRGNQGGDWSYTGWDVSFKKRETYPNNNESPHISGEERIRYIDSHTYVRLPQTLGVDGGNSHDITYPVHAEHVDFPKLYNLISEYSKFINIHTDHT